ncbi:hypothetical protein OG21DRAFT_1514838 [Imleria badia]|nr:hypothetical protein OG21DRAFT_1514838 [Imleria badia]
MVVAIQLLSSHLYALLVIVITCISSTVHVRSRPSMSYAEKVGVLFFATPKCFRNRRGLEKCLVNSN